MAENLQDEVLFRQLGYIVVEQKAVGHLEETGQRLHRTTFGNAGISAEQHAQGSIFILQTFDKIAVRIPEQQLEGDYILTLGVDRLTRHQYLKLLLFCHDLRDRKSVV